MFQAYSREFFRSAARSFLLSDRVTWRLIRHGALFVILVLFFAWVLLMRAGDDAPFLPTVSLVFLHSVFFMGYAYLTAYVLVPELLTKRRYILFAVLFLLSGMVISVMKLVCSDYLFYEAIGGVPGMGMNAVSLSGILVNTKDMTFIVALFLVLKYTRDTYRLKIRMHELQGHRISSEIRLLKSQMDPDVVFNHLNNLYCLSLRESTDLAINLGRLGSLLNYYFMKVKSGKVLLSQEIQSIKDFLDLEKIRFGNRLAISYKVSGDPGSRMIFPLVLFSFIEVCMRRKSAAYMPSWIMVHIMTEGHSVTMEVTGSVSQNENEGAGNGAEGSLELPSGKLELLYPGRFRLQEHINRDQYLLKVCLDI